MTPRPVTPDQTRKFLIIMWVGMVWTLPLYYFITTVVKPNQPDPNSPLIVPLLAAAVLMVLLSFYVKARFGAREGQARTVGVVRVAYILALVLTEVPALLGIIAYFVSGWPKNWVFFLISAAGYVFNFPKREDFEPSGVSS